MTMLIRCCAFLLSVALLGCTDAKPPQLEFRIAETTPAKGLTEFTFNQTGESFFVHPDVLLTENDVASASAALQGEFWAIHLSLNSSGKEKFAALTGQYVGKQCAMILDGELVSAPLIRAPITEGKALIISDFTEDEARDIAGRF
jgi:preprotein translocase subunit SecD